jgi:hypothetical protein
MKPLRKLRFAGLVLFLSIPQLHAQPIIANQPVSQTNLPGTTVSFSVAVNGTGPFTYQWQFNGANLANIITTVAGGGSTYPGDGGAATNAILYWPNSVAFDASGNLYFAQMGDYRIRKVDTNGIITTVANDGSANNGVACDASGNLYIANGGNNRILKVATNGIITTVAGNGNYGYSGDGGAATNASLY